jgi:hypothetical protein
MDTQVLLRQVRDGEHDLRFHAAVLAAATTERPGAPRWTELTVYRTPVGDEVDQPRGMYVVAKVGRSVVAHRPGCEKVRGRRYDAIGTLTPGGGSYPVPCLSCQPDMGVLDPGTLLERTRHLVLQARTPADLVKVLLQGRPGAIPTDAPPTGIVAETIRQVRLADPDFDRFCTDTLDTTWST